MVDKVCSLGHWCWPLRYRIYLHSILIHLCCWWWFAGVHGSLVLRFMSVMRYLKKLKSQIFVLSPYPINSCYGPTTLRSPEENGSKLQWWVALSWWYNNSFVLSCIYVFNGNHVSNTSSYVKSLYLNLWKQRNNGFLEKNPYIVQSFKLYFFRTVSIHY